MRVIYSMTVSVDGFMADRDGGIAWSAPSDALFGFHLDQVSALSGLVCGRRLYETMLVWELDPSLRDSPLHDAFADVWCALPKIVFSRTLDRVHGNARLAQRPLADELAAAQATIDGDVELGGADLAAQALALGLVDELRIFRAPVAVGGGTPFLPPLTEPLALTLLDTRPFDSGVVFERYRVGGDAAA